MGLAATRDRWQRSKLASAAHPSRLSRRLDWLADCQLRLARIEARGRRGLRVHWDATPTGTRYRQTGPNSATPDGYRDSHGVVMTGSWAGWLNDMPAFPRRVGWVKLCTRATQQASAESRGVGPRRAGSTRRLGRDNILGMSKIDQLTSAAKALPEAQLDGLIAFARDLASEPAYDSASPEALASIERGLAEHAAGESKPASEVFARLGRRIDHGRQ